jgi:hypothetical protein
LHLLAKKLEHGRRRFFGQCLAGFDRILISADRHGKLIQPGADGDRQGSAGAKKSRPSLAGHRIT